MEKESSAPEPIPQWKEKTWNLIFLLVGALIGFGLNLLQDHFQHEEEKKAAINLLYQDVEYQVNHSNLLIRSMENLKTGQIPDISPPALTLDRALNRPDLSIRISLPSHKSPIADRILQKLDLIPNQLSKDVLQFYSNLFYCDSLRSECQDEQAKRQTERTDKPGPICDIYLKVLGSCKDLGEGLLTKIKGFE